MTTYYVDSRATGSNTGDPDGETGPDGSGIYQNAFQSIPDIPRVFNATIVFVKGSGPYRLSDVWNGVYNNTSIVGNGVVVSGGIDLNNGLYKWSPSSHGTNEYYCELIGGGNPSISLFDAAVVDGHFFESSAENQTYQQGSPGSLENRVVGYGNTDGLGYDTVYIRDDALNPGSIQIEVSQLSGLISTNFRNLSISDLIFELSGGSAIWLRHSTGECAIKRCIFRYIDFQAVSTTFSAGDTKISGCLGYFTGHRFVVAGGTGNTKVYNCSSINSHLFALIDSTGACEIKNCIGYGLARGAIHKNSAESTLDEDYNCWYPIFERGGVSLAYTLPENWPTTGAHDLPPSAPTTINSIEDLLAAGGADPLLSVGPDLDVLSLDDLRSITLLPESKCIGSGISLGADLYYLDGTQIPNI